MLKIKDFIRKLFKTKLRSKPEKIWCFYPDPYRQGLAATGLAAAGTLAIILFVFLGIAIIGLGIFLISIILYALAAIIVIGIGASGLYGFNSEKVGVGVLTTILTVYLATILWEPAFALVDPVWLFAQDFIGYLSYTKYVTDFISNNWYWIVGAILAPVTAVSLIAFLFIAIIYSFRGTEQFVMWIHGVRQPCPVCHKPSEPAIYRCPDCDTTHPRNLIPSQYGVFSHECISCNAKLPTLMLFSDKKTLPHKCKQEHCKTELTAGVIGKDRHIAFVGGKGAGKTCLLLQATHQLVEKGGNIPEPDQQKEFDKLYELIKNGQTPPKTQKQNIYRAFQVEIKKKGSFPYHLHFYDIAGENFEDASDTKAQKFFSSLESIIFVFDPFFLPEFRKKMNISSDFDYSNQPPLDILHNLYQALERYRNKKSKIKKIVFNVLLVKTDTGYLKNVMSPDMREEEKSQALKEFIKNDLGQNAFIYTIESNFSNVNYFHSSALGRIPRSGEKVPFTPENLDHVLEKVYKKINVKI
jgi:hypothetical protein